MAALRWNLINDPAQAEKIQVFSGGACNIRDIDGKLLRNVERDDINDWLTEHNIVFHDPQIHPDTHGTEYKYEVHHPLEIAAREAAAITLFEMSPRTFGGVTSLEIALDEFDHQQPKIIFFSDGDNTIDVIPQHSQDGYPLFAPYGIKTNAAARHAHYKEMIKNANRLRRYILRFAEDLHALTVSFGEETFDGDVVITPRRIHAADMFEAVTHAAAGRRVVVNFTGGDKARDQKGNPIFLAPEHPNPVDLRMFLDQYIDEGNDLRKRICNLVRINVFVRVVYTQRTAIQALDDLMQIKGIKVKA